NNGCPANSYHGIGGIAFDLSGVNQNGDLWITGKELLSTKQIESLKNDNFNFNFDLFINFKNSIDVELYFSCSKMTVPAPDLEIIYDRICREVEDSVPDDADAGAADDAALQSLQPSLSKVVRFTKDASAVSTGWVTANFKGMLTNDEIKKCDTPLMLNINIKGKIFQFQKINWNILSTNF
ncbi:MAG: hypothetical protein HQK53_07025, partial [Oligoflexia bacterium]|nr:hypothetical protein [Oligoflexia bacterium]